MRLFGMDLPEAGADWNIQELTEAEILEIARKPGGIAWMERVGMVSEEGATELRRRVCGMCGRLLNQESDPLSTDCAGDCWGCVGVWEIGFPPSRRKIRSEIRQGLRFPDGTPKPPPKTPGKP
jgi:hypothetical protein